MDQSDLLHRALHDIDFSNTVRQNPSAFAEEYNLSDQTVRALESGDESRIRDSLAAESDSRAVPNQ